MSVVTREELRERALRFLRSEGCATADLASFATDLLGWVKAHGSPRDEAIAAVLRREADTLYDRFDDQQLDMLMDLAFPLEGEIPMKDDQILAGVMQAVAAQPATPKAAAPPAPTTPPPMRTRLPNIAGSISFLAGFAAAFLMGLLFGQGVDELMRSPPTLIGDARNTAGDPGGGHSEPMQIAQNFSEEHFDFTWPEPSIKPKGTEGKAGGPNGSKHPDPSFNTPPPILTMWIDDLHDEGDTRVMRLAYKASKPGSMALYRCSKDGFPVLVHTGPVSEEPTFREMNWDAGESELLALVSDIPADQEPLVLEGAALEKEVQGLRPGSPSLEAIRVWAFQEARARQVTLSIARGEVR